MYTNEHQKCLLESYKRELESKKFQLVALKATVAQKKDSSMCNAEDERSRADALERELKMVCLGYVGGGGLHIKVTGVFVVPFRG